MLNLQFRRLQILVFMTFMLHQRIGTGGGEHAPLGYWVLYGGFEVILDNQVGSASSAQNNPVVYPDPVNKKGSLAFLNNEHKKFRFNLMDAYGRLVYTEELTGNNVQMSVLGLDRGIYYYSLTGIETRESYTGKFVVAE